MKVNSSTISSTQLSQLFRSLSYAIDVGFLDNDSNKKFFKRLGQIFESNQISQNSFDHLIHSMSKGQIDSKLWLINTINKLNLDLGTVYLCAGWYATLLLCPRFSFNKIRNVDIDNDALKVATILHKHHIIDSWKYLPIHKDIHEINYQQHSFTHQDDRGVDVQITESPDTIINTSCEHIDNFSNWFNSIPPRKLIILQSNNGFEIPDHKNSVHNLQEFEQNTPLSHVLYSSELKLFKFTRYMRIGYK